MSNLNKDLLSKDVLIYPSANAIDGGQLNTEENLSSLSDKFFFRNFVVKRSTDTVPKLAVTKNGKNVIISNGECFIEGRYNLLRTATTIDMSTLEDEFEKTIFDYIGTKFYIFLQMQTDLTGCVEADKTNHICGGLKIIISSSDTFDRAILLGTVTADDANTMSTEDNDSKYCIIDISQVGSEDGTLEDTINRLIQAAIGGDSDVIILNKTDKQYSPAVILKNGTTTGMINNPGTGTQISYNGTNSVLINQEGVIYTGGATGGDSLNLITKINDLEDRIDHGGVAIAAKNGSTSTNDGATKNGNSEEVARANHYHPAYVVGRARTETLTENSIQYIDTNLTVKGEVKAARVYNAIWNDYADAVPKAEGVTSEPGDIISKDEYSEGYVLGTSYNAKLVVGVHSDTWGHLLGGTDENFDEYIPIAVAGNVRVKVIGKVKIGDFIVASFVPGVGVASQGYVPGTIVGKALENKDTDDVSRVLMQVMLI